MSINFLFPFDHISRLLNKSAIMSMCPGLKEPALNVSAEQQSSREAVTKMSFLPTNLRFQGQFHIKSRTWYAEKMSDSQFIASRFITVYSGESL